MSVHFIFIYYNRGHKYFSDVPFLVCYFYIHQNELLRDSSLSCFRSGLQWNYCFIMVQYWTTDMIDLIPLSQMKKSLWQWMLTEILISVWGINEWGYHSRYVHAYLELQFSVSWEVNGETKLKQNKTWNVLHIEHLQGNTYFMSLQLSLDFLYRSVKTPIRGDCSWSKSSQ